MLSGASGKTGLPREARSPYKSREQIKE